MLDFNPRARKSGGPRQFAHYRAARPARPRPARSGGRRRAILRTRKTKNPFPPGASRTRARPPSGGSGESPREASRLLSIRAGQHAGPALICARCIARTEPACVLPAEEPLPPADPDFAPIRFLPRRPLHLQPARRRFLQHRRARHPAKIRHLRPVVTTAAVKKGRRSASDSLADAARIGRRPAVGVTEDTARSAR